MGRLYLARSLDRFKIGHSNRVDFERRFRALRSQNAFPVEIVNIWDVEDAALIERVVQRGLSQYHVHDEWFDLPPENAQALVDYWISQYSQIDSTPSQDPTSEINRLRALGWSKKRIIQSLFNSRPGKSQAYIAASTFYDEVIR